MDFQARMNALSTGDKVVGAGLLVALISLFLPWYGFSFGGFSYSESGFYGVGWVYLLLLLASAVYWGMKVFAPDANAFKQVSSVGKRPDGSGGIGHWQVFLGGGVIMFLFSLIYYFSNVSGTGLSIRFGWFVGLIGAILIAVGGFMARDAGAGFGLGAPSTGSQSASTIPSSPPPPPAPPPPAPVDTNVNAVPPTAMNEPTQPAPAPVDPSMDETPPTVMNEPTQSAPPPEPTEPAS